MEGNLSARIKLVITIVAFWCWLGQGADLEPATNEISPGGCDRILAATNGAKLADLCQCRDAPAYSADSSALDPAPAIAPTFNETSPDSIGQLSCFISRATTTNQLRLELAKLNSSVRVDYLSVGANITKVSQTIEQHNGALQVDHYSLQLAASASVPIEHELVQALGLVDKDQLRFLSIFLEQFDNNDGHEVDVARLIAGLSSLTRLELGASQNSGPILNLGRSYGRPSKLKWLNLASSGRLRLGENLTLFSSTTELEYLNLAENKLEKFPIFRLFSNPFQLTAQNGGPPIQAVGLANLSSLNLMGNKLGSLERDFFSASSGGPATETLAAERRVGLQCEPPDKHSKVFLLPSLNQLDLSHNQLRGLTFNEARLLLCTMPQLNQLYLQHNKIKHVNLDALLRAPVALPGPYRSTEGGRAEQPAARRHVSRLELLDLGHNGLLKVTSFQDNLQAKLQAPQPRIKSINLGHNNLRRIVDALDHKLINRLLFKETFEFDSLFGDNQLSLANDLKSAPNYLQLEESFNLGPANSNLTLCDLLSPQSDNDDDDDDLLNELVLTNNRLEWLNSNDFNSIQCKHLQTLRLQLNQLTLVDNGTFAKLPNLEHLDLSDNLLTSLIEGQFAFNLKLKVLNLANNRLRSLARGLFWRLNELEELFLADNELSSIEADLFAQTEQLNVIDLSNNQLIHLDEHIFQNLAQLRVLNLNGNKVTSFNHLLFEQPRRIFNLIPFMNNNQNNFRQQLSNKGNSGANARRSNVTTATSRRNFSKRRQNRQLDEEANNLLVLASNQLGAFGFDNCARFMQNIQIIWLNDNHLQMLTANSFRCSSSVQRLYLQYNRIHTIDPQSFQGLTRLEYLDISNNHLAQLGPKVTSSLRSLRHIDLSHNRLSHQMRLSQALNSTNPLEVLKLNNNPGLELSAKDLLGSMRKFSHSIRSVDFNSIGRLIESSSDETSQFEERDDEDHSSFSMESLSLGGMDGISGDIFLKYTANLSIEKLDLSFMRKSAAESSGENSFIINHLRRPSLTELKLDGLDYVNERLHELLKHLADTSTVTLKHLSLSANRLDSWPLNGELANRLAALESLNLSANKLRHLIKSPSSNEYPNDDYTFARLLKLNVSHNSLIGLVQDQPNSRISQLRFVMPQVRELDLSHNRLTWLPYGFFDKLSQLKLLKLDHNQLETLPPIAAGYQALMIELSYNKRFKSIALESVITPTLKSLLDSSNFILTREENFASDFTNFKCQEIDEYLLMVQKSSSRRRKSSSRQTIDSITEFASYDEFNANVNKDNCELLMQFVDSFNLESAHMRQFEIVDNSVGLAPRFVSLSLRRNDIVHVDARWIHRAIINLDLSENKISNLSTTPICKTLSHLASLDLSNNLITEMPHQLFECHRLKYLDLSSNMIGAGSVRRVEHWSALLVLKLHSNRLASLHGLGLQEMKSLRFIDLRFNQLESLDSLYPLSKLHQLHLVSSDDFGAQQQQQQRSQTLERTLNVRMAPESLEVESRSGLRYSMDIQYIGEAENQTNAAFYPESSRHSIKFCALNSQNQFAQVCFKSRPPIASDGRSCLLLKRDPEIASCLTELRPPVQSKVSGGVTGKLSKQQSGSTSANSSLSTGSRWGDLPADFPQNGVHNESASGDPVLNFIDYLKTSWLKLRDLNLSQRLALAMNIDATNDPVWLELASGAYKIHTSTLIKFAVLSGSLCIVVFLVAIFVSLTYLAGSNKQSDNSALGSESELTCSTNDQDKSSSSHCSSHNRSGTQSNSQSQSQSYQTNASASSKSRDATQADTVIDLHNQLDANGLAASVAQHHFNYHNNNNNPQQLSDLQRAQQQQQQICLTPSSSLAPSSIETAETLQAVDSIQSNISTNQFDPSGGQANNADVPAYGPKSQMDSNYGQLQQPIGNIMRLVKSTSANFNQNSSLSHQQPMAAPSSATYGTLNPRYTNYSSLRTKIRNINDLRARHQQQQQQRQQTSESNLVAHTSTCSQHFSKCLSDLQKSQQQFNQTTRQIVDDGAEFFEPLGGHQQSLNEDDPATLSLLSINTALSSNNLRSSASQLASPISTDNQSAGDHQSLCQYHRLVQNPGEYLNSAVILEQEEDQLHGSSELFFIGGLPLPPPPQSQSMRTLENPPHHS